MYISDQIVIFFSAGGIIIGVGTVIGPHVVLMTSMHNYDSSDLDALPFDDSNTPSSIRIEKFCWIGTNVIVLLGVTIGEGRVSSVLEVLLLITFQNWQYVREIRQS
jgi:acetyltransferase-like isoleucine patch superfamily enzyme